VGDVSCPYGLAVPVRPVDSRLDYCNAVRVTYSTEQYPPITAVQPHPLYHLHTPRNVSAYRPLSTLPSNLIHSITYTRHATQCIGVSAAINTAVQPHPLHHLHTPRHAMYRRIGRYKHCRPTASTTSPTYTTPRNVSAHRPLSTLPSNRIHYITYTRHDTQCIGASAAINTAVQPHPLYHLHTPRHAMYRRIGRYQHCRPTSSTTSPTHAPARNVSAHRPLSTLPSNRIHSITYTRHATQCIGVSAAIGVHNTARFVPACRSSPSLSSSICAFVWRS